MSATTENALSVRIQQEISALQVQAARIVVKDRSTYQDACQFVLTVRARIKAVGRELDPGINKAKEVVDVAKDALNLLKLQKDKWVNLYATPASLVENRAAAWMAEDNRQRQVEQDRINEKARLDAKAKADEEKRIADAQAEADRKERQKEIDKQRASGELKAREAAKLKKEADERAEAERKLNAEQAAKTAADVKTVHVESGVPVVAGIRRTEHFYAEVAPADEYKLIDAMLNGPAAQRAFLQRFIKVDNQAIGKYARDTKDNQKVMAEIPGVKAWSEHGM